MMLQTWHKYVTEKRNSYLKEGGQKVSRNRAENRHFQAKAVGQKLYRSWTEIGKLLGNYWVMGLYQFFTKALPENGGKCRRNDGEMMATKRRLKGDQKCHQLVTNVSPEIKSFKLKKWYQIGTKMIPKNCINSSLKLHQKQLRQGFGEVAVEIQWVLCNIMMTIIYHLAWSKYLVKL